MLLELPQLKRKYGMKINGLLHVGAHLAEEAKTYAGMRIPRVWWVEANPRVLPKIEEALKLFPDQTLIHALVYEEDDCTLDFHVTNYDGMSSSILEFGTHTSFSPDTVFEETIQLPTKTLDTLVNENEVTANFLMMDLQGAELHALRGAMDYIETVDYVMTEVNNDQVYIGCAQVEELDEFLSDFQRVETFWVGNQGWGDALYVRR